MVAKVVTVATAATQQRQQDQERLVASGMTVKEQENRWAHKNHGLSIRLWSYKCYKIDVAGNLSLSDNYCSFSVMPQKSREA